MHTSSLQSLTLHSISLHSRTDEELVRLALCGDISAYDTLVYRFRGAVILVAAQALPSREIAEDVAQEVFLVAFKSLTHLRDPKRFANWLYAITRYRARRVWKQEQHTVPMETETLDAVMTQFLTPEAESPERALMQGEFQRELACAIANLKPEYQIVFLLRSEERWPLARISEFLALPVTTIKWRLHQARQQLKQQILAYAKEFREDFENE